MAETGQRVEIVVPWRTLLKLIAAIVLVRLSVQLRELILVVLVSAIVAVALDPLVRAAQRRGLSRSLAAFGISIGLLLLIGGFLVLTWSSLASQATLVGRHLGDFQRRVLDGLPAIVRNAFAGEQGDVVASYVGPAAVRIVRSFGEAVVVFVLAFILMLYLLIEGARTYQWVLAFVPEQHRGQVQRTAEECRRVVAAYVVGNVATSVFATIFVLIVLTVLKVPAAMLLALLAGLCDFVPVLGFAVSAVPAILLAMTVSASTAAIAAVCYVSYHLLENYLIGPRVYGGELKLSNLAVVLAFAVGAALGGVVGALIALPIAASYPAIEAIWLRRQLPPDTVAHHKALQAKAS
jgi:predicted PurR-regulated permease PerM